MVLLQLASVSTELLAGRAMQEAEAPVAQQQVAEQPEQEVQGRNLELLVLAAAAAV
jgi:7-cyano-7-deazaguanine synthase in queuosine biosynthesis